MYDWELLVAYVSIRHFRHFCEGHPFQLWTDHKPLVTAFSHVTVPTLPQQQQKIAFISKFIVQMLYLASLKKVVANFQLLLQEFQVQPTIDAFTSQFNNRCASFYSKTLQKGAAGIDFFAQELRRGEVYYCCPPVKLAAHCIRRIWSSKGIRAVLVLPHWAGASYWPLLLDGESYKAEVKQWRSWRAESQDTGRAASLFTTGRNVQMWAGLIQTGKN
jgi:hypothetical protein